MGDRLLCGVMSGTSADGVDVAVVRIDGVGQAMRATLVAFLETPYGPALRQTLHALRGQQAGSFSGINRLCRDISLAHAAAINATLFQAGLHGDDVTAAAVHGQTLFHAPPLTWQLVDPALIASETQLDIIHDFRRADCAAGGQGAPLVPFADYVLFRDAQVSRVILNIGGIANLTYLPRGGTLADVIAFDTGPGNCVSDALIRTTDPTGPGYDVNGATAARGIVDEIVVDAVLAQPFFHQPPPKSTDGPQMQSLFDTKTTFSRLSAADRLATAMAVTADAIGRAITTYLPAPPDELLVAGGGVKNAALMIRLRSRIVCPIRSIAGSGVPAQAREAMAFALLGAATLDRVPANVPSATGARRPVVLGSITPRP